MEEKPCFGAGPAFFLREPARAKTVNTLPWYALLLGGMGLAGVGTGLAFLAELAARALGREGRRCLLSGGVLGGTAGLAAACLWSGALPKGGGAMVGLLLAFSALEEPEGRPLRRSRTGDGD
ncbi:MAG: hypothetical protein FWG74_05155 [Planctomycetes bacterium]|nr:hypothetical protein [Planctomycetota bacterium]